MDEHFGSYQFMSVRSTVNLDFVKQEKKIILQSTSVVSSLSRTHYLLHNIYTCGGLKPKTFFFVRQTFCDNIRNIYNILNDAG